MDWLIVILNLYSYFLIGAKKRIGFIYGLAGCIAAIIIFYKTNSLVVMYLAFGILNIKGYLNWRK